MPATRPSAFNRLAERQELRILPPTGFRGDPRSVGVIAVIYLVFLIFRIKPSWATLAIKRPSGAKTEPRLNPLAPPLNGLSME